MSKNALSLKYRPQNYDDLVGQDAVSKSLKFALENQRIANAYLFSGLRGSGKTTTARILARALNCEKGISAKPCGECASCTSVDAIDIIELDAASNRGIESIQELINSSHYAPLHSRFKIYIIDEVHMLTKEAFNALLKTLEEPPKHVKFILATTDAHKLPATILSRVLHFRFKKIPDEKIAQRLAKILSDENIKFEVNALKLIAKNAQGSLRDAITLLEQAIIYSSDFVDEKSVAMMLGMLEGRLIDEFFQALKNQDENAIMDFINEAKNYEIGNVLEAISQYLKDAFFSGESFLNLVLFERFFEIISRASELAKINDDDEFILCLLVFMMKDALRLGELSEFSEEKETKISENEKKFQDFCYKISQRDLLLGEIFNKHASFISFDGFEYCIKINPANEEQKQHFKKYYQSVVKAVFSELFSDARLVLVSDLAKEPLKAKEVQTASKPTAREQGNNKQATSENPSELTAQGLKSNDFEKEFLEPKKENFSNFSSQNSHANEDKKSNSKFDNTAAGSLEIAPSEKSNVEKSIEALQKFAAEKPKNTKHITRPSEYGVYADIIEPRVERDDEKIKPLEEKMPTFQSDDFLELDYEPSEFAPNEFEIDDSVLEVFSAEVQDIMFESLIKVRIDNNCCELHVLPPKDERAKAILRKHIKEVLALCNEIYLMPSCKIVNVLEEKKNSNALKTDILLQELKPAMGEFSQKIDAFEMDENLDFRQNKLQNDGKTKINENNFQNDEFKTQANDLREHGANDFEENEAQNSQIKQNFSEEIMQAKSVADELLQSFAIDSDYNVINLKDYQNKSHTALVPEFSVKPETFSDEEKLLRARMRILDDELGGLSDARP